MDAYLKKLRKDGIEKWNNWSVSKTDDNLYRFATIIISVHKIRTDIIDADIDLLSKLIASNITKFKRAFTTTVKDIGKVSWRGTFELEPMCMINARYRDKKGTIRAISGVDIDALSNDERIIVLHIHMLVYGESILVATELLKQKYYYVNQVDCRSVPRTGQTLEQAIDNITDYCFKFKFEYAYTDANNNTKFINKVEPEMDNVLTRIYNSINISYDRNEL